MWKVPSVQVGVNMSAVSDTHHKMHMPARIYLRMSMLEANKQATEQNLLGLGQTTQVPACV